MQPLIIILILVALGWALIVLPQRRRSRAHEAMQDELAVGDEIITAGGLHAVVKELGEDELIVEIAPNVLVKLDRRAVAAVAHLEPEPEVETETSPEAS
jgi:preprotein translocase subunit YajC